MSKDNLSALQQHYSQSRAHDDKVVITWTNIEFQILEKDKKLSKFLKPVFRNKAILKCCSGRAESGELLAIMGPTGCGKTSLLNCLAARVTSSSSNKNTKLTGSIYVNGVIRNDESFRKISAYVLQDDKLYPHLTVFETLLLSAHFFLGDDVSFETKTDLVNSVITELGLNKVTNTLIGDEKVRGVSGGERKRANIAVQLISDPAVLFLDEPTSGLDSFQAQAVMESMKNMSLNGRLVISVIHQPRSTIFDMFDQLYLLSEGRTIYQGKATTATSYFATLGFNCPKLYNPADYFLDILSPDNRTFELEEKSQNTINSLADQWIEFCDSNTLLDTSKFGKEYQSPKPITHPMTAKRFLRNFSILCWRSYIEQTRQIVTFVIKMVITCFFGFIIGGVYSHSGYSQHGINNRIGILFVMAINQGFNGTLGVLNSFPKEKIIVNRERSTGAYDTFSYFTAKYFVEAPLNVLPCIVFTCIIYWIVGLNPHRFGFNILILVFEVLTATSLGLWISSAMPSIEAANVLGPPAVIIALLFAGYYINVNSIPIVANWIPYLSFIKWAFEALAINEFRGATFNCNGAPEGACITTGDEVLYRLSFGHDTIEHACFGLGMVLLGFTVCAAVSLHFSKISYINLGFIGSNQAKTSS